MEGLNISRLLSSQGAAHHGAESSVKKTSSLQFSKVMDSLKIDSAPVGFTARGVEFIDTFIKGWNQSHRQFNQELGKVAPQYRSFVQLQMQVNDLHMQSELMSKTGEAFSQTVRKVQQMGAS